MVHKFLFFITPLIVTGICLSATTSGQSEGIDGVYSIKVKTVDMIISAAVGGRIISLRLDGKEILSGEDIHPRFYGSTLWLSPEGRWKGQGVLDNGSYHVDNFNGVNLQLTSQTDSLRGFAFKKQFIASPSDTSIEIQYTITNISKDMQEVSPWEVTRVATGGLAFFPKSTVQDTPKSNKMYPLLNIHDSMGMIWYPYDSSLMSPQKLFMDGDGWMAYVYNRLVFIKKFPVINSMQAAPGEKNVEVYVNKQKTYIELENQGVYTQLEQKKSLHYEVKWYVRRLPDNVKVDVGSPDLMNYVRSILNRK